MKNEFQVKQDIQLQMKVDCQKVRNLFSNEHFVYTFHSSPNRMQQIYSELDKTGPLRYYYSLLL